MSTKATYTLDDETLGTIRRLAEQGRKPQSQVVREAVAHYAAAEQKTSPGERTRWVRAFDELLATVPPRAASARVKERREVRASRRQGWRGAASGA